MSAATKVKVELCVASVGHDLTSHRKTMAPSGFTADHYVGDIEKQNTSEQGGA